MSSVKVLIVLSDASTFDIKKSDGSIQKEETGVFLMELAKPLTQILDAGYQVTFTSPKGGTPNIDPLSDSTMLAFLGNWWEHNREQKLIQEMHLQNNMASPRPFSSITDAELDSFAGIFIPGGHAPLTDLGNDPQLGRIIWHFHNKSKPTATICHGPYALLSTIAAPGSQGFAYKGYQITSWSNQEEKLIETLKSGEIPKVETALQDAGASMVTGTREKFGSITVDRELVSGANPMAAQVLGEKFVEMLKA